MLLFVHNDDLPLDFLRYNTADWSKIQFDFMIFQTTSGVMASKHFFVPSGQTRLKQGAHSIL